MRHYPMIPLVALLFSAALITPCAAGINPKVITIEGEHDCVADDEVAVLKVTIEDGTENAITAEVRVRGEGAGQGTVYQEEHEFTDGGGAPGPNGSQVFDVDFDTSAANVIPQRYQLSARARDEDGNWQQYIAGGKLWVIRVKFTVSDGRIADPWQLTASFSDDDLFYHAANVEVLPVQAPIHLQVTPADAAKFDVQYPMQVNGEDGVNIAAKNAANDGDTSVLEVWCKDDSGNPSHHLDKWDINLEVHDYALNIWLAP